MQCKICKRPIKAGELIVRFRYTVKPDEKVHSPMGSFPVRDWYGSAVGINCRRCHVKSQRRNNWLHSWYIEENFIRYGLVGIDRDEFDQRIQEIASDPFDEKWLTKHQCESCGREIWNDPSLANQRRVHDLCSGQCRKNLRAIKKRVNPMMVTCRVCGKIFSPKRRDAKTCGTTCRQQLRRSKSTS